MNQLEIIRLLNDWEKRDFNYGDADCCQFAGWVVKNLTGKDYLETFNYNTESQANAIIRSNGTLEDTVSTVLGESTESINELPDGSPVLVNIPNDEVMGIKLGKQAVCLAKHGFLTVSQNQIKVGWKLWAL